MALKVRKQVYIEPEQEAQLKRITQATGVTEAALIRQALRQHLQPPRSPRLADEAWAEIEQFFAARAALPRTATGRTWRREDAYTGRRFEWPRSEAQHEPHPR
jgi:hypothetical protein